MQESGGAEDINYRTVILEGPPFAGKHSIVQEVYEKLMADSPLPDKSDAPAPFLLKGKSPWRSVYEESPASRVDPENPELSLSHVVQLARSRMRKTLDLLGLVEWQFSFAEKRPVFTVGVGVGPGTFLCWLDLYAEEINARLGAGGPAGDVALGAMEQFVLDHEAGRWSELGMRAVWYLPEKRELLRIRKKDKKETKRRNTGVPKADRELPRDDISLEAALEMVENFKRHSQGIAYPVKLAYTREEAVNAMFETLQPAWRRAVEQCSKATE